MDVSTAGLDVAAVAALAGLRANEARYFKNKYDHVFTVEPAAKAKKDIESVTSPPEGEREIVIASPPLEATAFQVDNIRWTYVFYESGLSIIVLYTLDGPVPSGRSVQALRRDGRPLRVEFVLVCAREVEAGRDHPRLVLRDQGPVLSPAGTGSADSRPYWPYWVSPANRDFLDWANSSFEWVLAVASATSGHPSPGKWGGPKWKRLFSR